MRSGKPSTSVARWDRKYRDLGNLGKAYLQFGQLDRALQATNEALTLARQYNDEEVEQLMLMNLGAIYTSGDDLKQAYEVQQQALEITRRRGDRRSESMVVGNLGILHDRVGLRQEADELHKAAVEIGKELNDDEIIATNLVNLACLFLSEKAYPNAALLYRNSIVLFQKHGNRSYESKCLAWLGLCLPRLWRFRGCH
ncbi:MAG: tetratricopeptide repeat protein [Gammaproteobacteria bacterium]